MSVDINVRQNINTTSQINWYVLLEKPDSSFEVAQADGSGVATFTINEVGIYKVYSYGDNNPGAISSPPTNINMPTGTTIPSTPRMYVMDIKNVNPTNTNLDVVFEYDFINTMPGGKGGIPTQTDPCNTWLGPEQAISMSGYPGQCYCLFNLDNPSYEPIPGISPNPPVTANGPTGGYDSLNRYFMMVYTNIGGIAFDNRLFLIGANGLGVEIKPTVYRQSSLSEDNAGVVELLLDIPNAKYSTNAVACDSDGYSYIYTFSPGFVYPIDLRDTTSVNWAQIVSIDKSTYYYTMEELPVYECPCGDLPNWGIGFSYSNGYLWNTVAYYRANIYLVRNLIRIDPNTFEKITFSIYAPINNPISTLRGDDFMQYRCAVVNRNGYIYIPFPTSSNELYVRIPENIENNKSYLAEFYTSTTIPLTAALSSC